MPKLAKVMNLNFLATLSLVMTLAVILYSPNAKAQPGYGCCEGSAICEQLYGPVLGVTCSYPAMSLVQTAITPATIAAAAAKILRNT